MTLKSKIWNRGFFTWLILSLGVINLIVGLQGLSSSPLLSCFNFFVSGLCVDFWFQESLINKSFKLCRESLKMCSELIKVNKKLSEERFFKGIKNQKEVKKR